MTASFEGRVAIVTGAGGGLGRSHALALAARGARVVVNDLGASRDGTGGSSAAAEAVVEEIRAAGGEGMANGANITSEADIQAMVDAAMTKWGRIDILVNNAGILRDKTFSKMTMDDFRTVVEVHLMGSAICTKAVWDIMRAQNYGRVVMTTSPSGLFGNFGQANYASAKLGLVGLMNTLCIEGQKNNIRVNCLSPGARTRMTEGLASDAIMDLCTVESVSAGLLMLVAEDAPTRLILSAVAGGYAVNRIFESKGIYLTPDRQTPEAIAAEMGRMMETDGQHEVMQGNDQSEPFVRQAAAALGVSLG